MNTRKLGRSDLQVSELCLNTGQFGWASDEEMSFALLDQYHAGGGRFIQTLGFAPNSVAAQLIESVSEDIVGRWREKRGIPRGSLVLASRIDFFRPPHGGSIAFSDSIRGSVERSVRRLRAGHLDLLICEWDDPLAPAEDLLEAVDRLIRAGIVRHAVAGGFPPWRVVDANHRASVRYHARFEAVQGEYSLLRRDSFEPEIMAMCRDHRLGFLARSPLGGGFLARRPASLRELINVDRPWTSERFGSHFGDAVLRALGEIADNRNATPAQIALAWVIRNPQVTSAAISAQSAHHLDELIRAADLVLTPAEIGALANVTRAQDPRLALCHA